MKQTTSPRKDSFCIVSDMADEVLFINDKWIKSEKLGKLTAWLVQSSQAGACC